MGSQRVRMDPSNPRFSITPQLWQTHSSSTSWITLLIPGDSSVRATRSLGWAAYEGVVGGDHVGDLGTCWGSVDDHRYGSALAGGVGGGQDAGGAFPGPDGGLELGGWCGSLYGGQCECEPGGCSVVADGDEGVFGAVNGVLGAAFVVVALGVVVALVADFSGLGADRLGSACLRRAGEHGPVGVDVVVQGFGGVIPAGPVAQFQGGRDGGLGEGLEVLLGGEPLGEHASEGCPGGECVAPPCGLLGWGERVGAVGHDSVPDVVDEPGDRGDEVVEG